MTLNDWFDLTVFFAKLGGVVLLITLELAVLFVVVSWIENMGGAQVRDRHERW